MRARVLATSLLGVALAACGPHYVPAGPPVVTPYLEAGHLVARDGARLPVHRWTAARARGLVVALHSFGDYGAAFARLGPILAEHGYTVLAPDQRGFGDAPHPGRWPGDGTLTHDIHDLLAASRGEVPVGAPVYLLGESLGGATALLAATTIPDLGGLILAAPAVREDIPFRYGWNAILWGLAAAAPSHREPIDHLNERLDGVARERLAGDANVARTIRVDTYYGLIRLADAASDRAGEVEIPTLVIFGTGDATVRPASICALMRRLGGPASAQILRGGVHRILHDAPSAEATERAILAFLAGEPLADDAAAYCRSSGAVPSSALSSVGGAGLASR